MISSWEILILCHWEIKLKLTLVMETFDASCAKHRYSGRRNPFSSIIDRLVWHNHRKQNYLRSLVYSYCRITMVIDRFQCNITRVQKYYLQFKWNAYDWILSRNQKLSIVILHHSKIKCNFGQLMVISVHEFSYARYECIGLSMIMAVVYNCKNKHCYHITCKYVNIIVIRILWRRHCNVIVFKFR